MAKVLWTGPRIDQFQVMDLYWKTGDTRTRACAEPVSVPGFPYQRFRDDRNGRKTNNHEYGNKKMRRTDCMFGFHNRHPQ
jgi:hypothetical protein